MTAFLPITCYKTSMLGLNRFTLERSNSGELAVNWPAVADGGAAER